MVEYRRPFLVPDNALGFEPAMIVLAGRLLNTVDLDAIAILDRALTDDSGGLTHRLQLSELRAAKEARK